MHTCFIHLLEAFTRQMYDHIAPWIISVL